jgi:CRISPR-associated protein Cas5
MRVDVDFFLDPPMLTVVAELRIEALAPLSMVGGQGGSYYRSQPAPTESMLYGMLENALGWHFSPEERKQILDLARKRAKCRKSVPEWIKNNDVESAAGYRSLLQHHLKFTLPVLPTVMHYDDLWSQHLRDTGRSFFGGSRSYDYRLEPYVTAERQKRLEFGDRAEFNVRSAEDLEAAPKGSKIHYSAVRDQFPQYYVSPKVREYVVPNGPYRFRVVTTEALAERIRGALADPAAPLYLGSNDGWVDASWEDLA